MNKKELITNKIICGSLLLYFLILCVERVLSLIFSIYTGGYPLINGGFYAIASYVFTLVSVIAALVLFFNTSIIDMFKVMFKKEIYVFDSKRTFKIFLPLTILLFGAFTNLGFSIDVLQASSFGLLFTALIAKTVQTCLLKKEKRFDSIISVIYIILFFTCTPGICNTFTSSPLNVLIYIDGFASVLLLIPIIGVMLIYFFNNDGASRFHFMPLLAMVIIVSTTIGLRWVEYIEYGLLICAILTVVCFVVRYLIVFTSKSKNKSDVTK